MKIRTYRNVYIQLKSALIATAIASSGATAFASDFCSLENISNHTLSVQDYSDLLSYADKLGWIKKEDLPAHLKENASPRCDGFYIDQARQDQSTSPKANLNTLPITIEADTVSASTQNETSVFKGEVVITQATDQDDLSSTVTAGYACYDKQTNHASLTEHVFLNHSGSRLLGDKAEVDLTKNQGQLDNALFAVASSHLRGQADQINFDFLEDTQRVHINEGNFTFCEPSSNAWKLDAKDIELDFAEGWGEASHITLEIQDVPVLYLPWMNFPLDDRRKTGFLYPSFEVKSGASSIATPFYLNLAPNYDATLTPRYFEHRGPMLEAEFRYLNHWSMNTLSGGYLQSDNDYPDSDTQAITGQSSGESRWSFHYDHLGKVNGWRTEIDFNKVSDKDYQADFGGLLSTSQSGTIDQLARVSWSGDNISITAQFRGYQITDPDDISANQYEQLPDLNFSGFWFTQNNFHTSINIQATHFDRIAEASTLSAAESASTVGSALRGSADIGLEYQLKAPWGHLTPGLVSYLNQYTFDDYNQQVFDDSANAIIPAYYLKGGLSFERKTQLFNQAYYQTLEPEFMFTYIPYVDQNDIPLFDTDNADLNYHQLFNPNRFTGRDRVGDTSQISFGFSSRLYNASGDQTLVARAGSILYLKDRKIDLTNNHSQVKYNSANDYDVANYLGELELTPSNSWSYQLALEWSDRLNQTARSSHKLRYQPDNEHVATLRYNEKKGVDELSGNQQTREEFLEFSAGWQVSPFWTVFHRWEYDLAVDRTSDIMNGFEYNNCCWRAAIVYRHFYTGEQTADNSTTTPTTTTLNDEFDSGIFFTFELKGLAGLGASTDSMLEELIEGINQRTIYDY
jgi:LPS-assembly protein